MSFCLPVKNGWQLEQISRRSSWFFVERVVHVAPQAQWTLTILYSGWIPGFMALLRNTYLRASRPERQAGRSDRDGPPVERREGEAGEGLAVGRPEVGEHPDR